MAKREKLQKTNAMRELERAGIAFEVRTYEVDESDLSGVHVAEQLGEEPGQGFKTLVTASPQGGHVVCCIPVAEELDLKRAAAQAGEKSLSMLAVRDLLPVTGYLRGGCSPVGMKKRFPTIIDESCLIWDRIFISGGRRGIQLVLAPEDLVAFTGATVAPITRGA
ncbi:Cys-tRNA(Pro) deacylase [Enorma burkinafasonensis]|uniref:Cys-tRNA(Pro) deacylase n=1 Tax=Enorma burkinafasonensis TaxID=2590867 RepID=UPI0011A10012|nr:Cys-tRNA(Pro) deacylase [Enorma burkinafasonensis]